MSRTIHSLVAISLVRIATAQPAYTPPDPWDDALKVSYGIWEQLGQVQGTGAADVQYYTDGAELQAYFQRDGRFSLVLASVDTIIATPDTLKRLDVSFTGEDAQTPDALAYQMKDYIQNFYLPWCGPNGVTNVHGYSRVVYEGIYPFIDMHVYSGSAGQKMAFVVRPGGDPDDLQLLLEGQDQLGLDIMGNLRILIEDKWIVLRQAVAYQVEQNNSIEWLNWTADYVPNNNTGVVGFTFDAYDDTKPLVLLIGMGPMDGPPVTPGVCYATYFGGSSSDFINANTIDSDGNHYVTGATYSTFTSFPGQTGNNIFFGSPSLFARLIDDQDHIEWKDFFGGSDENQGARGIAVREGADPKVYVGGWTACTDFYCFDANPGNDYYDDTGSGMGSNGFIVRLNQSDGVLEHSSYFGTGTPVNEVADVTIDPSGRSIAVGTITAGALPTHQVPLPAGPSNGPTAVRRMVMWRFQPERSSAVEHAMGWQRR
ncbi:MAG: hypothetical protein IPG74_04430 [Flavobacteriales bacterium]|nr:hypothetical protein [Flavobacteriales bacterium]